MCENISGGFKAKNAALKTALFGEVFKYYQNRYLQLHLSKILSRHVFFYKKP